MKSSETFNLLDQVIRDFLASVECFEWDVRNTTKVMLAKYPSEPLWAWNLRAIDP